MLSLIPVTSILSPSLSAEDNTIIEARMWTKALGVAAIILFCV